MTTASAAPPSSASAKPDGKAAQTKTSPPATLPTTTTTTAPTAMTAAAAATAAPSASPTSPTAPTTLARAPTPRRRPQGRAAPLDPLSDKATVLLIRKTLCPEEAVPAPAMPTGTSALSAPSTTSTAPASAPAPAPTPTPAAAAPPIEELLPPLTSRNDVDLQLYGLLAVVVREFVQTWYGRITPDTQLATEIVHIFAHCSRALEQRLRRADLEALLFDELPALLDGHVQAYRLAYGQGRHGPCVAPPPPLHADPRAVYHALLPLPPLDPVPVSGTAAVETQAANEAAYRQLLVRAVLVLLLPTEDLQNDCLVALLGQILAELLLGGVLARRVAEPWMLWEVVGMLARLAREKLDGPGSPPSTAAPPSSPSSPSSPSFPSSPSPSPPPSPSPLSPSWLARTATSLFWSAVRFGFALFAFVRFLAASVVLARSLPPRRPLPMDDQPRNPSPGDPLSPPLPPPVLAYSLWPALASLLDLDLRMPWLAGFLSLLQWLALAGPGRFGAFDRPLDRLLSYYLCKSALDPALLPTLLRALRGAVFPGNKFGAVPPTLIAPANPGEEAALRRRTAEAVWSLANGRRPASEAALAEINGVLDVFSDVYCNKHLLYGLLEAVLVRLMPELADQGVLDLWEERLT